MFRNYPGWYPDSDPYTFYPPFKPLVHKWDDFLELIKTEADKRTKMEMQMFRRELDPLLKAHFSALAEAKATGVIAFKALWLILAPGELMLCYDSDQMSGLRLRAANLIPARLKKPTYWDITLDQCDWNGSRCDVKLIRKEITDFAQPILATKLSVYPLYFAPDHQNIRKALLARGRQFENLRGFHVMICTGKKYIEEYTMQGPREVTKPISGRVIIDSHAYYACQEKVPLALRIWGAKTGSGAQRSDRLVDDDEDTKYKRKEDLKSLSNDECVIANPRVRGFDLKAKEWCEFNVEEIHPPKWDNKPYEKIVLPPGEKELVAALVQKDRPKENRFDDFVQHKGEGTIILLCGPPGVGKTLTVEAMAEKSERPLYVLSASELGTKPSTVEPALQSALQCCELWNAVLLLDEADIFLQTRDSSSLERNELVSIFLRALEYYRGLLFLTTNRIDAIDPAFKSRIDLIIPYKDLTKEARREVWVNFISRLSPKVTEFTKDDFNELAKAEMNGREIKNTVKTALLLAEQDGVFSMQHIKTVLGIRKRIMDLDLGHFTAG
ncbi:hypothetical protein CDD81_2382 [Ophiocordyceps australis]|uniref:AAA+ ATPase domain-containing protein n=1 Tax=Ophiocordyceps australis TaxID=1399860 RepID=A0A2C5XX11_9HYPO|nr:hypothetical protein CDD81_2382 [Ophiocordyceps australis]